MKIDWAYLRKGWQSSKKAQEALAASNVVIEDTVDARKIRYDSESAWQLLKSAKKIVTATGKKVQNWNPKTDDKESILKQAMGRSGNLRVPTLLVDNMYVIGFNSEFYDSLMKEWFRSINRLAEK